VMDCFFHADGAQPDFSTVEAAHSQMVDQVVEVDEDLMELYLEQGEELSPEQLHDPFEQALREGHLIPVCFVSARTGAGVVELLEVLERLMPNPDEGNPPAFLKGEGGEAEPVVVSPDPQAHAIAHVVKVDVDPFKGRLGVVRVHQGTLRVGAQVYVGEARKPIKITHLLKLNGKTHTEVDSVIAGDICAIPRADEVFFDGVLHDSHDEDHFHVRSVDLPPPMYGLAIKSSNDADARKIADGLHTLQAEDPSLHVEHNAALNETVLRGVGDLHLRIAIEEVQEQYNVELETSLPSIPYRETITAKSEGHSRHKKQTGGAGQFGEVFLRVEPLPRGAGFEFENQVVGGAIPFQFIPAVEKGIREVLHGGAVAGYELQDVKAIVYDGKHHAVDSKEIAFVAAGKKAFLDAIGNARPIVMEPVVNVSVTVPDHCMGDVTGDLSAMRGMVNGTTALPNNRLEISGQAPLQELQSYHSRLKSLSGGEGSYTLDFSHYGAVPAQMQKELQQAYRPQEED
jgi:elongation factor G